MHRRPVLLLAVILAAPFVTPLLAQGSATASPIVFNGLIVQDGKVKVSLHNPNNGDAKWVQVGKKFGNYTVERYQPGVPGKTADTVVLTLGASSQRITLQGSANNPVVASVPAKASATAIANDQLESLERSIEETRKDPNADPQLLKALQEASYEQRQVVATLVANTQIDGLSRSLAEARKDPNANPRLIKALEDIRQDRQQMLTTNNVHETPKKYGSVSDMEHPDGGQTRVDFNADGTVRTVVIFTPDANGPPQHSELYRATDPESQATLRKIEEASKAFAESQKK